MLPQQSRALTGCCCHGSGPHPSAPARRGWDIAAAALSIGLWVFMPKCPICLAAHVALWTGLGLSFGAAAYLRTSLLLAAAVLLFCLVARRISMRWLRRE
jgi:hypothetical protein